MTVGLKPYPEYRESGVTWTARVPSHWKTERAQWLFTKTNRPSRPEDDVVTCFRDGTVTLRKNRRLRGFTEAIFEFGYQGIRKGDLVIHAMDAFAGAVGVSDSDGKGTPVYSVCQPNPGICAHYYAHIVREMARSQWILAIARGIRERSTDFRYDAFRVQPLPVPPPEEQNAIVRFLGHMNWRLERAIRTKKKLITLLNEQKQAIIHRAVTRGLDPNVEIKPSNVPWLGDIPKHWDSLRSRYLFREIDERSKTGQEIHLSMSQRLGLVPNSRLENKRLISESYVGAKVCQCGDLVLNRLKAHLGVFALSPQRGLVSPDYTVFRPVRDMKTAYFELLYRTPACQVELRKRAKGIVQGFWRLYSDDFYDIRVPLPPPAEQIAIVERIKADVMRPDASIAQAQGEIDLIREFRTRLIADVVTGQFDVREAERGLPSEDQASESATVPDDEDEAEELPEAVADDE